MLNGHSNRGPLTAASRLAVAAAIAAVTIPIAVVAQNQFSTLRGVVVDQTNRVLPGVTLALTNTSTSAKYEVKSDRTGHYEFVGLPAADYALAAFQPGFEPLKETVAIKGADVTHPIQLAVGHLQETIRSVAGAPSRPEAERAQMRIAARASADRRIEKIKNTCASAELTDVGGNLAPPLKVVDVKPVYPEQLQAAKTGGLVTLDALIGTDGAVREVKTTSSENPDLERAAIDAVRQWEFTPTYLNCTAIEVHMQVSISFVPAQ